jgi:hypothetical protein
MRIMGRIGSYYDDIAADRFAITAINRRFANTCDKPMGQYARRNKRLMTAAITTLLVIRFLLKLAGRVN